MQHHFRSFEAVAAQDFGECGGIFFANGGVLDTESSIIAKNQKYSNFGALRDIGFSGTFSINQINTHNLIQHTNGISADRAIRAQSAIRTSARSNRKAPADGDTIFRNKFDPRSISARGQTSIACSATIGDPSLATAIFDTMLRDSIAGSPT